MYIHIITSMETIKYQFIIELAPNEASEDIPQSVLEVVHTLGEGGPTGDLPPGKSIVFACLEVCLCLLVRRLPALSPLKQEGTVGVIGVPKGLGIHGDTMLVKTLAAMSELPSLTSPQGKEKRIIIIFNFVSILL